MPSLTAIDLRSNWTRAIEGWPVHRSITSELLIEIGRVFGELAAENLYLALAREPVDAHGGRVDWVVIRAGIRTR